MSYIRLANFFELYSINSNGNTRNEGRYNNATPGRSIRYGGSTVSYTHLTLPTICSV